MPVTIQQLEIFRAVARNLSFSVAAQEVYTSQPHVSNQIRKLEKHYQVSLFIRSHPGISLTEAGLALYQCIDKILDDIEEVEQVVQEFRGLQRGSIRLGATESVGNHVVPGLVARFKVDCPEIVVQLRVGNTRDVHGWLERDKVEVGISPRQPDVPYLKSEPFYDEDLVVIHPIGMTMPDPLSVADLDQLPKVIREDGSLTLAKMDELLDPYPSTHHHVAQLTGTTAVNEAVAAGLGVSLVPERSARAWLEAGSVGLVRLSDAQPSHSFSLVYSLERYITPAARAFIEFCRTTMH